MQSAGVSAQWVCVKPSTDHQRIYHFIQCNFMQLIACTVSACCKKLYAWIGEWAGYLKMHEHVWKRCSPPAPFSDTNACGAAPPCCPARYRARIGNSCPELAVLYELVSLLLTVLPCATACSPGFVSRCKFRNNSNETRQSQQEGKCAQASSRPGLSNPCSGECDLHTSVLRASAARLRLEGAQGPYQH